jgi:putrescine transport system substrate-binding protein
MRHWLVRVSCAALMAVALVAAPAARAADQKTVNVYNWSDYVAKDTIAGFEKQTGIHVNYDVYDSNETLEAKLMAGHSGYDVVVPTAAFIARRIRAGTFLPLDKAKLPNWSNLDPGILKRLAEADPGNRYAVPYMWGTQGLGYNAAAIEARMPNAPTDSWDLLFKPDIVAKFADCGVAMLDSPSEIFPIALNYLGLDRYSTKPEDYAKVEAMLTAIRPSIRYFNSSQYIDDLANGEICLAFGYNGDIYQARRRAKAGVDIRYSTPKEGTTVSFDVMAIPADAPHPDAALAFINYILTPQVAADITDTVYYANPNAKATPLVKADIRDDPGIYPPAAMMGRLFIEKRPDHRTDQTRTRIWTRVKTGE